MKKIITYGSFDLFHQGHHNLLKRAKSLGDYLIVGVTTEHYDEYRGKMNIVDPLMTRIENVRNTGLVDEIIIEDHEGQKITDIQKYGIDVFTVGTDWRGTFDYLKEYCEVVYIDRTKNVSSTELRNEKRGIVRIGLVGSGNIASRFMKEVRFVSGCTPSGVFTRRAESAQAFANNYELEFHSDDYDELLSHVDAVYVATPHETHYEYARRAILAKKHVLCEKPMTLSEDETRELFRLSGEQGVVLMEAVKTAYTPGFSQLLAIAKSGRLGKICDVEACFTKLKPTFGEREFRGSSAGSFTELASYALLPIMKLLGHDYKALRFESICQEDGLDVYTKAFFTYDGAMATAKTGLGVKSEGQLVISGTNGYILVASPWWITESFEVCYEDRSQNEKFFTKLKGENLRYEIADFVRAIGDGARNSFRLSERDSIAMAGVIGRFLDEREGRV